MMRALIKENPTEGYALKEIPIPEPGEDELVFKVERVIYLDFIKRIFFPFFAVKQAHCKK